LAFVLHLGIRFTEFLNKCDAFTDRDASTERGAFTDHAFTHRDAFTERDAFTDHAFTNRDAFTDRNAFTDRDAFTDHAFTNHALAEHMAFI
jgi:hypothetical protein